MNKTILFAVGAIAVVVVGASIFMNTSGPGGAPQGFRTLQDLIGSSASVSCTFSHAIAGLESAGTVYAAGGKMRGDFTSKTPAGNVESHMIVMDQTIYTWTSLLNQGIKLPLSATAAGAAGAGAAAEAKTPVDFNQQLDYSCDPWATDQSKFSLPQGMTFTDVGAMMQGAGAGANAMQCAACDQAPAGAARDACKQALGC